MTYSIQIAGLSKQYPLVAPSRATTLRDELASALRHPMRTLRRLASRRHGETFWALKDIDLELPRGEAIGVIGRNGAGKSTLLKILSRITEPTSGRAIVRGRLASLLEVGTGFHPELSGRENVYLNATILGMRKAEIARKFNRIVEFSGIERFIDTPVKHYSSGMYVRLAFAVAAHVDADILLVDEVLAVGDAEFQRRCLGRMEDVASSGRTVVLVSHSLDTVAKLCQRTIWLDGGRLKMLDSSASVISAYVASGASGASWQPAEDQRGAVAVRSVWAHAGENCDTEFAADRPFFIAVKYSVIRPVSGRIALLLRDERGTSVLNSASTDASTSLNDRMAVGEYVATCTIPGHLLSPGMYSVSIAVPEADFDQRIFDSVVSVRVSEIGSLATRDGRRGAIAPLLDWEQRSLDV